MLLTLQLTMPHDAAHEGAATGYPGAKMSMSDSWLRSRDGKFRSFTSLKAQDLKHTNEGDVQEGKGHLHRHCQNVVITIAG